MRRRVFISGGTGDIGAAIVRSMSALGHDVVFQYYRSNREAGALSDATGARAVLCNYADIEASDDTLMPADWRPDILIHCAGVNLTRELTASVPVSEWRRTLEVNLTSGFRLASIALPDMVKNRWGRLVFVGSIYGDKASPYNSPYNVSKHALTGLVQSIAIEYGSLGITANQVMPGPVLSRLFDETSRERAARLGVPVDDYLRQLLLRVPAGRCASVEDVVNAVIFLSADASSYVNGCSIPLDGGLLARA